MVGGEAGFGIMASGILLVRTFARGGLKAITINDYPSLIRGGHNVILVKVADHEIFATDTFADILIALNRETVDLHKDDLSENAAVIFDNESFKVSESDFSVKVNLFPVPLMRLSKEHQGDVLMRNTVALGATLGLIDYDFSLLESVITDQFKRKGEVVIAKNIAIAKSGYEFVKKNASNFSKHIHPTSQKSKQMVLNGNEAVGLGAIAAGMKFFAAYPMTPINGLLYYLAGVAEKTGFVYKQPEDEIAAINMAIGASFAGVRSMVATSGGGFSLMVEGTSLAGMIEQSVVIIFGQRPGPATGLPTWTTQSDLHFILNAGQGEFPRLALAPGDVEEAFKLTATAFNLAEKYQTPVFVLVDKYLCETYFTCEFNKLAKAPITIDRGKLVSEADQIKVPDFKRYAFSADGISPRPIPGRTGGVFRVNSDEHNEEGYSIEDAITAAAMIEKRMKKLDTANKEVPPAILYGAKDAQHTLVGWGSTKGPVLEAMRQFSQEGQPDLLNYLHISWVNPFPTDSVRFNLDHSKHIIDIEGNHNSQMADWILLKTGIHIKDRITKYDGRPFTPREIKEKIISYG